ncbi:MAG: hypothetical protein IT303_13795 [Dehalococcoidia bacterium]|nr:hypothetical protein [Dehalococcoidia bacterium]
MSIKATSALSILAIWAAMIPAVIVEPDAWWSLIFAGLATASIGVSAWRRLGISRVIAVAGTWSGTALAVANEPGATWIAIFAFLSTGAIVYSVLRRDAWLSGLGIAAPWLATGIAITANEGDGAWICVFAFLTTGAVANAGRSAYRGLAAILWWGIAGAIMVIAGGWAWLAVPAFVLSGLSIGVGDFRLPRRFEWDLFDRDDDGDRPPGGPSARVRGVRWESGRGFSGFPFDDRDDRDSDGDAPPAVR